MKRPATLSFLLLALVAASARAAGPSEEEYRAVRDKALAYLRKSQSADGSYSRRFAGPGITALVAAAFLRHGVAPDDPAVAKMLASMEESVQKDGGIYDMRLANYTTSVALMTFVEANKKGKYDALIKKATEFLKGVQRTDVGPDHPAYGGAGYDGKSRPDLSNTQFTLEALIAAGVPKDDPAIQRYLKFVSRCQNLPGETNDQKFAEKTTDDDKGGLTYTPIDPDDSEHKTAAGGLRSLGAMTYGGLKSFLYAGVKKDDPRVKAATDWIRRHYTLEENIGMGQAGLYYYYHTFAKALDALGEDPFVDAKGNKHAWRQELFEALKKRQRPDGSFQGTREFGEADPNLATAFALLALEYCKPLGK